MKSCRIFPHFLTIPLICLVKRMQAHCYTKYHIFEVSDHHHAHIKIFFSSHELTFSQQNVTCKMVKTTCLIDNFVCPVQWDMSSPVWYDSESWCYHRFAFLNPLHTGLVWRLQLHLASFLVIKNVVNFSSMMSCCKHFCIFSAMVTKMFEKCKFKIRATSLRRL